MTLRLNGSTSGFTQVDAPAAGGNNTLYLPTSNGSNRQAIVGDGSGNLSFQWDAGKLFYRLNSDYTGANVSTVQSMFGVGVTLAASTVYAVEGRCLLNKTTGSNNHTLALGFGGTATANNMLITATHTQSSANGITSSPPYAFDNNKGFVQTAVTNLATFNQAGSGVGGTIISIQMEFSGTISVNAAGTFIPQYQLSAAPGGAYSTIAGSYIRLTPIGAAGSNSSQGTWS